MIVGFGQPPSDALGSLAALHLSARRQALVQAACRTPKLFLTPCQQTTYGKILPILPNCHYGRKTPASGGRHIAPSPPKRGAILPKQQSQNPMQCKELGRLANADSAENRGYLPSRCNFGSLPSWTHPACPRLPAIPVATPARPLASRLTRWGRSGPMTVPVRRHSVRGWRRRF